MTSVCLLSEENMRGVDGDIGSSHVKILDKIAMVL